MPYEDLYLPYSRAAREAYATIVLVGMDDRFEAKKIDREDLGLAGTRTSTTCRYRTCRVAPWSSSSSLSEVLALQTMRAHSHIMPSYALLSWTRRLASHHWYCVWHCSEYRPTQTIYRPIYYFGESTDTMQNLEIGSYVQYVIWYPAIQYKNYASDTMSIRYWEHWYLEPTTQSENCPTCYPFDYVWQLSMTL